MSVVVEPQSGEDLLRENGGEWDAKRWGHGGPKIALRGGGGGGGGWHGRPAKDGGGGGFRKWAPVPGPLFCVRTDVPTKGAGTQILARKIFFTKKFFPTYV